MRKIIIIGSGKMGESLARGFVKNYDVLIVGRNKDKLDALQKRIEGLRIDTIDTLSEFGEAVVVLAVKPYDLVEVAKKIQNKPKLLISILAGTTIQTIRENIKADYYVRAMPNIASQYGKGMTALTGDEEFANLTQELFRSIGKSLWLQTENELDIATAVAGSGPAYLALVAEALIDGGVKSGLSRRDANILVHGLFEGFVPLIEAQAPNDIKNSVMSPGGTTAAAIDYLEQKAVRSAFMGCVASAYKKALDLAKR